MASILEFIIDSLVVLLPSSKKEEASKNENNKFKSYKVIEEKGKNDHTVFKIVELAWDEDSQLLAKNIIFESTSITLIKDKVHELMLK